MSTKRALKSCGAAVALVLALAGCMKMDIDVALQPDDTVDGAVTIALARSIAEMGEEDPESMADQMRDDLMDSEAKFDDVRVEPYATDDFVGSTMHFEGGPLDVFDDGTDEGLKIERDGDDFVVSGVMDMSGEESEQIEMLGSAVDIRIAVTFPGPVAEHDGELDGTTVVWTPKVGERLEMNARGAATGNGAAPGDGAGDTTGDDAEGDGTPDDGATDDSAAGGDAGDDSATEDGDATGATTADGDATGDSTADVDAAAESEDGGLPTIAAIAIGLGVLAALAVIVLLLLRNRSRAGEPASTYEAEGFGSGSGELDPGTPATWPGPAAGSPAHGVPPVAPPPLGAMPMEPPSERTPPSPPPPSVIPPSDAGTPPPEAPDADEPGAPAPPH